MLISYFFSIFIILQFNLLVHISEQQVFYNYMDTRKIISCLLEFLLLKVKNSKIILHGMYSFHFTLKIAG